MANSLLDVIRNKLSKPQAAPQVGQTEQASNLLRTKLTGQATPQGETEAKRSTIGEQAVQAQTQAALGQEAQQGAVLGEQQAQQAAAQTQGAQISQAQLTQGLQLKQAQAAQQAADLWNQFNQSGRQLQTEQDLAKLEQVAFNSRLASKQYIDQIQAVAKREGLDSELKFKEDYYKQVFEDQASALSGDIAFKKLMDSDERQFIDEMSRMDLNFAMDMAKQAAKEANQRALFESIGGLVSGGLQGYQAYDASQTKKAQADYVAKHGTPEQTEYYNTFGTLSGAP